MFNRRGVTITSSFGDRNITSTDGNPFYLIEEGTNNKILTEDLFKILLGYLKNWKEVNTKTSSWVRRNFTGS